MFSLNSATGIAPSDVLFWPLGLETVPLLVQKVGQTRHQRPEADDGGGAHHLVGVAAQQVFVILEERLDVPAQRQ